MEFAELFQETNCVVVNLKSTSTSLLHIVESCNPHLISREICVFYSEKCLDIKSFMSTSEQTIIN